MDLSREQIEAIDAFARIVRNARVQDAPNHFVYTHTIDDPRALVLHGGTGKDFRAAFSDLLELQDLGILRILAKGRNDGQIVLTNNFRTFAQNLHRRDVEPVQAIEVKARSYVNATAFSSRFPVAHKKWLEADKLMTSASPAHLTAIGHHCREAMRLFAASLCDALGVAHADLDPAKTVERIRRCLNKRKVELGDAKATFLEALLGYWGTVSDLVQRQEHGGMKGGAPLTEDDGRRTVFYTALVMYELASTLGNL